MSKPVPSTEANPSCDSAGSLEPLTFEQVQQMIFRAAFGDVLTFTDEKDAPGAGVNKAAAHKESEYD